MSKSLATREGQILVTPLFSEPMRVGPARLDGSAGWTAGLARAMTERFRKVTLIPADPHERTPVFKEKSHGYSAF